jgi:hypothetical protein
VNELTAPSEGLLDLAGPLVVKELRQGLRAKVFGIVFGLVLISCLAVALVAFAEVTESNDAKGPKFMAQYLAGLGLVTFFVIPFTAFRSMMREREDETWVLLLLTGLGARSIVRGKWLSAMTQATLFASACAPFVLFSYFLNGIDLVHVVVALAVCATWSALVTAMAIALATQSQSRLARSSSNVGVIVLLLLCTFAGDAVLAALARSSSFERDRGMLETIVVMVVLALGTTRLVLDGAAYAMALPSELRASHPRRGLLGVVLLTLTLAVGLFALRKGGEQAAAAGALLTSLYLVGAGLFAISERDGYSAHDTGGWLGRPGASRSVALLFGLLVLEGVVWCVCAYVVGAGERARRITLVAPLYPMLYLSLGVVIGRSPALKRFGETVATRAAFVGATAAGIALPMLASVTVGGRATDTGINLLNPIVGLVNFIDRGYDIDVGGVLLLVSAAGTFAMVALAMLRARDGERA